MNDVTIGTYSMQTDFGLYLPEYTIPAPPQQTKFVTIIGRDGAVDLSSALGIHYDSRKWTLDFKCFNPTVNWHTLMTNVMNAIHGQRLNFEFADDPNYFWTGRIAVDSYKPNKGEGTVRVTITSDPFKYAKLSTIVQDTVPKGTSYSGSVATFTATASDRITSLSASFSPIQDLHGYVNPWPAGGGANLFDPEKSTLSSGAYGLTFSRSGDVFTISGTPTSTGTGAFAVVTNYADSSLSGKGYVVQALDVSGGTINTIYGFRTESEKSIAIAINRTSGVPVNITLKFSVAATSQTTWTPYSNICPISGRTGLTVYVSPTQDVADATTYSSDWTSTAGTVYGGTLDVVTGLLTVDREIVNLGDYDWTYDSTYTRFQHTFTNIKNLSARTLPMQCSALEPIYDNRAIGSVPDNAVYSGGLVVNIKYSAAGGNTTAFKTAMNGVQLCYPLGSPYVQTYQLTPQQVTVLVGTNNVWCNGDTVSLFLSTPIALTNSGAKSVVPTVTASAQMTLSWGGSSYTMQAGTSTIPALVLAPGTTNVFVDGTGTIKFEWSEASL